MITEHVLTALEILGTIAFAVSGAFVAIKAKFDAFGVLVIGCLTAVGGGILRDILIGAVPPAIFSRLYVLGIAAATSLGVFIIAYIYRRQFDRLRERIERINTVFDAVGLAAFTAMGTEIAFTAGVWHNPFLSVTLGVLSGVGGGILRDILTETPPYIFKKHIYAVASIGGAALYYVARYYLDYTVLATALTLITVVTVRLLAAHYRWSLPKIRLTDESVADESLRNDPLKDVAVGDVSQRTENKEEKQDGDCM